MICNTHQGRNTVIRDVLETFAEGLHFTKEKIDKYFSNHVHDFATIAAPLQELIKQYDKRKKK